MGDKPAMRFAVLGVVGCVLATMLWGCGPRHQPTYPVRGRVVLRDGTPVAGCLIAFEAVDKSVSAKGNLDKDGRFELFTYRPGDGVPAGEYRAVLVPSIVDDHGKASQAPPFHARYRTYETSGLKFTVQAGDNFFEIKLDRAEPKG